MSETPRPLALIAELTYRCPLRCPYCSNPLGLSSFRDELDTSTWLRVLGEAAELGVVHLSFSGGEPLVRRDLTEMVREARRLDFYTNMSTGATLADRGRLAELREAGLDHLQISLLDTRPEKNDWMAGARSFDKKREALSVAKELGFAVTLNIVLHRHNLDHLQEVIDLAFELKLERLELAHAQYTGWAFKNRAALMPTREQLDRAQAVVKQAEERSNGHRTEILHVMPDYFQKYPKACLQGWGRAFLTVAPDGIVMPCQTAREIPGLEFPNVRDSSLEEIWFHAPVFERFRGTDWMPEPCQSCDRREVDFGGCRCQAFLLAGDPGATDPVCHLSPDHHLVEEALAEASQGAADLNYRVMTGG